MMHIPYKYHLAAAYLVRLSLLFFGDYQDTNSDVPYTDTDYKVFTDAARYVLQHKSPYLRHTYRYTPLLAYLLTPNVKIHINFGKVLFSTIDLLVGYLIRELVIECRKMFLTHKQSNESVEPAQKSAISWDDRKGRRVVRKRKRPESVKSEKSGKRSESYDCVPDYCMMFWIYNPMTVIISTRGNCDSIAACLVLLTLYLLQCRKCYFLAGLVHGLAVHMRLYPAAYSLSMFMYLSKFGQYNITGRVKSVASHTAAENSDNSLVHTEQHFKENTKKTIFRREYLYYLMPNGDQLKLISGCLLSLSAAVLLFYYLYGYVFLYETYLFHLIRKDTRHNFSLFFYLTYLTAGVKNIGIWQKVLSVLPQMVLLLVLSVRYGLNKFTLNFSIVTQTIVMVSYNSVLTSQYFVWILAVLPLTMWQFKMTIKTAAILTVIWFAAQVAWLLPAYLLEFHGQNTFIFVWLQGVSFFCANMFILGKLIKCYVYSSGTE